MSQFDLPVFVRARDCGEVRRYDSLIDMQWHLEQIDVENEEYDAWDAKGNTLILSVQNTKTPSRLFRADRPATWLRLQLSEVSQPQLAKAIADFARGNNVALDEAALQRRDFTHALEQITSELDTRWRAMTWWERFKRRF
jgi:hypothetical protein